MHNVEPVALRLARDCLHLATSQRLSWSVSRPWLLNLVSSPSRHAAALHTSSPTLAQLSRPVKYRQPPFHIPRRNFCHSPISRILKPYSTEKKPEKGLKFQDTELSDKQIRSIFGRHAPPTPYANRLLKVLHGRRIDGTLDLPLPEDVESHKGMRYPRAMDDALEYLRKKYPLDEDEAIIHRLAREEDPREQDHPSVLAQRGQDIGLYKAHKAPEEEYYGPQSGYYQAELSDKPDDPYGVSVFDQIREENIAKREKEEADLQTHIDAEMAKAQEAHEEQTRALAQRPEQALGEAKQLRPPNSFERWVIKARQQATSKLSLESPEIAQMTTLHRLVPSLLLAAALCVGCYFFAQYWTRPKLADRFLPNFSLSYATLGTILALNVAVWFLWKLPPWWTTLNKYFIFVPAYPYALSMVGTLFSHQTLYHLGMNMLTLGIFGLPLHEEIGRGNFLAIYLASGLIGGFASFARHVVQGNMATSVLGASGCVYGIVSAYLALHMSDRFSLFFIPDNWNETLSFNGTAILVLIGASQVVGVLGGMKRLGRVDHLDHLVGMVVGYFSARWWQNNGKKKEKVDNPTKLGSWWNTLLGKDR